MNDLYEEILYTSSLFYTTTREEERRREISNEISM
jgi:hypothetical protein